MDLPIKFPCESEVILDEVARFRSLKPLERIQVLLGMVDVGARLQQVSPKPSWMRKYSGAQERLAREQIREFIERHGR